MRTRDYSIFRNINGNRKITPKHVVDLTYAIERKNLLEYYPVLVNEVMEVIDGQHRLMAAAKLDYEVYYEKVKGLVLEDVMSINTASRSWTLADFVDAYIRLGNSDYTELREFAEKHHLNLSISAALLAGGSNFRGQNSINGPVRQGTFRVTTRIIAGQVADWLSILNPLCDFDALLDRSFISVLVALKNNEDFDLDRLLAKLRLSDKKIEKRADRRYYLIHIEELYNFNAKAPVELYASTQAA